MFNINLTAEQKLERAINSIMGCRDLAFYSSILLIGTRTVIEDDNTYGCETAMTDGRDEMYVRSFVAKLSDEELVFVVLHECMHKLFRHTHLWGDMYDKDPLLANAACDYVVNLMLMDMWKNSAAVKKVMQPWMIDGKPNFLLDERFRDMDAKQVFILLSDELSTPPPISPPTPTPTPTPPGGDGDDGDDKNDNDDQPTDTGTPSDDEGDGKGEGDDTEGEGDGKGEGSGDGDEDSDEGDGGSAKPQQPPTKPQPTAADKLRKEIQDKQFDQHKPGVEDDMTADERQQLDIQIDRAIRDGMTIAARMGAHVAREIGELTKPKTDWREATQDFVKQACVGGDNATWRRFNRKLFVNDIYAPTFESQRIGRLIVASDVSGSINHAMINAMVSNVVKICEEITPEEVVLMYWDDTVTAVEFYDESNYPHMVEMTRPVGGGGTNPKIALEYIKSNYSPSEVDCVIILTDGEFYDGQGDWSEFNVLWGIIPLSYVTFVPVHGSMVTLEL